MIGETQGKILSRNQVMNEPSDLYATRDPEAIDILHEYFIPAARFAEFIEKSRPIFLSYRPELLNITVRNVEPDQDTFLRYAPEEMFGLVLLFHQRRDEAAEATMKVMTRELIDAALACGGHYYLPYRPHATPQQFLRAYPQAPEFFALKRRYDPQGVFENQFYLNYGKALSKPNQPHRHAGRDQRGQLGERNHVGAVGDGLGRIGMRLDEKSVGARGERGLGERRHEFALAAALAAAGAGAAARCAWRRRSSENRSAS